jgi:hypothetical protein
VTRRTLLAIGGAACALAASAPASAAVYLVAAQLYSCSGDGTNGGPGAYAEYYQYSTNTATAHDLMGLTPNRPALLSEGANVIAFTTGGLDPGDYACINLYFDDVNAAFNPPYAADVELPGDLTIVIPLAGGNHTFPAAGIDVHSLNSSSFSVIHTAYSGATSFEIPGEPEITVTDTTITPQITGTVTIFVPEPGAATSAALALLSLLALRATRRS